MTNLKQFGFQLSAHTHPNRCFSTASLRAAGCALVVLAIMLPWLGIAIAQQERSSPQSYKEGLEIEKLELEVAKLKKDSDEVPKWVPIVALILVGVLSGVVTILVARRTRRGALDQSVHDKRLNLYPKLVEATARLALYFPSDDPPPVSIGREDCRAMGRAMSEWYFGGGGLLLSVNARDAYFRLARALTRASFKKLRVPKFPTNSNDISKEDVDIYRKELGGKRVLRKVEKWCFEVPEPEKGNAGQFRDFIFLQYLSSDLRTKLTKDLRSRRPPV